jgi:inosose dehydratase
MQPLDRRTWMQAAAAGLAAAGLPSNWCCGSQSPAGTRCTLSIGTYSLKGMSIEESIDLAARIGYDGLEISVQPGFDGEPAKMPAARCKEVGKRLESKRLKLTALMEQLTPAAEDHQHQEQLRRLQQVVELARQLAPAEPPLVQTVLGAGQWSEKKSLYRDRLGDWLRVFAAARLVLAIKPHRGGGMSRPEEAIWLIHQLGDSPWLRMVYDYSHYAFRDMPLEDTVHAALPYTAHVAVKDAVQREKRIEFLPPGESHTFDYARLLWLLYAGGYRGDVCCEVSAMVTKKPGYDPVATAEACYRNMAAAFAQAGVPRKP